jgi:hypothetical protein
VHALKTSVGWIGDRLLARAKNSSVLPSASVLINLRDKGLGIVFPRIGMFVPRRRWWKQRLERENTTSKLFCDLTISGSRDAMRTKKMQSKEDAIKEKRADR